MHKNLLLCTAACALFSSSFTFTSTSIASSLNLETRRPLERITKLPEQYRYATDFINTPTQAKKNLEKIAYSTMAEANASFNQEHQKNSETSLAHTENKHPVIDSSTRQKRSSDPLPSANVVSQHKDNSSLRTSNEITQPEISKNAQSDMDPKTNTTSSTLKTALSTSTETHVKLPTKIDSILTANAESTYKLTNGKAPETSSFLDEAVDSKTLTPQMENSLIMPIAMFAVGVSDANNQSTLLDNMQITMFEPKNYQERGIFLSTFGNKNTFFSRTHSKQENIQEDQEDVQTVQEDIQVKQASTQEEPQSIHADIRYAALQAGAILVALEHQNISTNFGFFGTYGKLSFAPKNAESSHKKMFDKWSLTAHGNIQHDSGIYASAFLSYGIFKENMDKNFIKDTPKMNNSKILGAAATVGQKLLTSFEGVILEPQVQLVYQHLMLGSSSDNNSSSNDSSPSDEDTSKINISKPDQWLVRVGGRLTQNKGHALSFYGKLNLIKTFSKNFQLAAMGSLVEGGFGIHAHLSQNIELHSDLSYQHKFKKVGISGINVSAGMRYHF